MVELGNASSTGYIDDELPDYVMIMVANKRPKQQMLVDLNLFLGSNTGKLSYSIEFTVYKFIKIDYNS